jgi:nucleoside triphosphatase
MKQAYDKYRVGVVGLIRNKAGAYLLCKMPKDRGMFPGQWAIPGGGMEPNETMTEAIQREFREEVGLEIGELQPIYFTDDSRIKLYPNGTQEKIYMIYLLFDGVAQTEDVLLNDEFEEFAWVMPEHLTTYDLNSATRETLRRKGLLS